MSIYGNVPQEFKSAVQSFKRSGESARISKPVIMDENKYYGIIYKPFIGKNISGLIFIDSSGSVVKGDTVKKLMELFYYYNLFFDVTVVNLKTALKSDSWLKNEESNYTEAAKMLIAFSDQKVEGAMDVKDVVDTVPLMRKEGNDALKTMFDKAREYENQNIPFSQDILDELIPLYEKSVLLSFQRVKYINSCSRYYENLKREAGSKGRRLKSKFLGGQAAINLENILSFFISILKYYEDSVNLSDDGYMKSIRRNHENNINDWYGKLRQK